MRLSFLTLSLLMLNGCDPSESLPLPTDPDSSPIIEDAAIVPDVTPVMDMRVERDREIVEPADAGIPSYVVDVPNDTLPDQTEYALVGGGDDNWFVWWRGGRLMARQFSIRLDPSDDRALDSIDPERVRVETGEPVLLGYAPPYSGRLTGIRSPNSAGGHPGWFFVPDPEGMLHAYDLAQAEPSPVSLGVTSPLALGSLSSGAEAEDLVLLGATTEAGVTFMTLDGRGGLTTLDNPTGYPLPESISTAGGRWAYAFDDGSCSLLAHGPNGPDVSLGFWRCGTGPDSHLIGRGAVGEREPGFYAIGHTEYGLIAWDMRPGSVAETPQIRPADMTSPESPANLDDAGVDAGADAGSDAGVPDSSFDASQPVDSGSDAETLDAAAQGDSEPASDAGTPPVALGPGVVRITESDRPVSVVNRLSDGLVLRTEEGQYILADRWSIRTLTPPTEDVLGAFVGTGDVPFTVHWDSESGLPTATRATFATNQAPPRLSDEQCPGRAPETCGHYDNDCDGFSKSNLCCEFGYGFADPELPSTDALAGDFFITESDIGVLAAIRHESRVELRNFVVETERTTCLGCWSHTLELSHQANYNTIVVMAGAVQQAPVDAATCSDDCPSITPEAVAVPSMPSDNQDAGFEDGGVPADQGVVDAGDAGDAGDGGDAGLEEPEPIAPRSVLLWHTGPGRLAITDSPCAQIRHLALFTGQAGYRLQVFCDSARYDYTLIGDEISEPNSVPYSFGAAQWIGPPVKAVEQNATVTYLLAAAGENFDLYRIRVSSDDITITPAVGRNARIPASDRGLPIRPSIDDAILPARIRDGRIVEVFQDNSGWRQGVSRRWLRRAYFSAHDPIAISVGEQLDPDGEGFDSTSQVMLGYSHDLRAMGNHWGREFSLKGDSRSQLLGYTYHGVGIADFPASSNERVIWLATAGLRDPIRFLGQSTTCRAEEE